MLTPGAQALASSYPKFVSVATPWALSKLANKRKRGVARRGSSLPDEEPSRDSCAMPPARHPVAFYFSFRLFVGGASGACRRVYRPRVHNA